MGSRFKSEGVHEIPVPSHEGWDFSFLCQSYRVTSKNAFAAMTVDEQIASLDACLVEILNQYDLGEYEAESINHEFNSTFKVACASGEIYALRINVNSTRTLENLKAEIAWVSRVQSVKVPKPTPNRDGSFISYGWHEASQRNLAAVLYSWLEGEELGDEPTDGQLRALGAAMAKLHLESAELTLPDDAQLPIYQDAFWGAEDLLTSPASALNEEEKRVVAGVLANVAAALAELGEGQHLQPIHADLHPWNAMWHEGEIAVFDFDDSGIGLPIQDIATAIYYLDTDDQRAAFLAGYESIAALPSSSAKQMGLLLLHRRILLLNYLYETSNPEHAELIPEYQAETFRRISVASEGSF